LTLVDCTISGNHIGSGSFSLGGGIYNDGGALTLRRCTFRGNVVSVTNTTGALASGGGLYINGGTVDVQLCTFSSNSAAVASGSSPPVPGVASGGAISNVSGGTNARLRISNSTFYQNTATGGTNTGTTLSNTGSSGAASATIEIGNTIFVAANPVISNSGGTITSDGYNVTTGGADGIFIATGDQINTDAQLQGLASNGGATQTHALSITSPAVDKGKGDALPALAVTTDQRGVSRPQLVPGFQPAPGGDRSDIGAFEVAPYVVNTTADHDDGTCNAADCTLREAIIAANGVPFTSQTFDTTCFAEGLSGTINLTGALPNLASTLEIVGPGANVLTVRRNTGGNYRIFSIPSNSGPVDVTISGLTLTNGFADPNTPDPTSGFGGCIYFANQTLHIDKCVLTGNNAYTGGAMFIANNTSLVSVSNSTISNNIATQDAGAVANLRDATFSNVTFAGNSSPNASVLLNISGAAYSTVFFQNCTLGDNSAGLYGIYNSQKAAVITLRNTILDTRAPGGNIFNDSAAFETSLGNNISSDAAGGDASTGPGGWLNQPGDKRNTDPKLDPSGLQDNGGPLRRSPC
jgi:CSLREA domain-containing protein